MKGKLLSLSSCHFPYADTANRWSDVWIQTTVKPGRTRRYLAPTLIGREDIIDDMDRNIRYNHPHDKDHYAAFEAFASGATHYIGSGPDDMANIYATEMLITREIAERLCIAYAQHLGIAATRVRWKRSKIFSHPA